MKWWDRMPWSLFSESWALSQLFLSPLSLSSKGSLVSLHFLLVLLFTNLISLHVQTYKFKPTPLSPSPYSLPSKCLISKTGNNTAIQSVIQVVHPPPSLSPHTHFQALSILPFARHPSTVPTSAPASQSVTWMQLRWTFSVPSVPLWPTPGYRSASSCDTDLRVSFTCLKVLR